LPKWAACAKRVERGGGAAPRFRHQRAPTRAFNKNAMPHLLSQLLYCARWVGTLLVLAVHASSIFISYGGAEKTDPSPFLDAWRFVVSFELGHQAVVGFFVMSGFLVGGAALAHLREEKPFLLDYFIHRIARIYLVLIPAILLTIVVDGAGRALFAGLGVYEIPPLQAHYDPRLIFTDLLNLQGIVAKFYGTNGPLWSIAYEFWYYALFPLLFLPFSRAYSPLARKIAAISAIIAFIAMTLPQSWFFLGFVLWGMGAAVTLLKRPLVRSKWLALALNIGVALSLRTAICGELVAQHPALTHVSDVISGLAFANLILTLRFAPGAGWRFLAPRMHKHLADFSFTVYAIHTPLLMFLRAATTRFLDNDWLSSVAAPVQWQALATAVAIVLVVAFLLSRVTEAKTGVARRKLRRFAGRFDHFESAAPAAPAPVYEKTRREDIGVPARYDQ
jgi:peptidoglycan/LPS O-acetylase OafA/YrhL